MTAYRRILVPVDGSPTSMRGLKEALRLAKSGGAQVFLIHVVDEYPAFASPEMAPAAADLIPVFRQGGKRILARSQAVATRAGVRTKVVMRETIGGAAADLIVREARKLRADLIVLGTHGRRGIRRLVLGSDAEQVVRNSPVPVLLVRASAGK
jgi:nucleotide-binding universal stress UspA family protein